MTPATWQDVARTLDHALLHPTLTDEQMRRSLAGLAKLPIASVCIKPAAVALCRDALAGSGVATGTVIGFPHGANRPDVKAFEASRAIADGAVELDMVANVGAATGGDWAAARDDIAAVLKAARDGGARLKVIFETDLLTDDAAKIRLCEICTDLGVDWVKTSTGFGFVKGPTGYSYTGATEHEVRLMREHSGPSVGVKASGGVRSLDDALKFLALGCSRLGTTSTAAILAQAHAKFGGDAPPGLSGDGGPGY